MQPLFLVMLGGAVGAGARHLVGRAALALWGSGFPVATLAVNVIGGLAMGLLMGWLSTRTAGNDMLRYLLGVGLLGGFTTFSAFSLETFEMLERQQYMTALAYITASVTLSVAAVGAGLTLTRATAA